jgi:hypothetical protein
MALKMAITIGAAQLWIKELVPVEDNLLLLLVVSAAAEAVFTTSVFPEMFKFTACTSSGVAIHTS